MSKKIMELKDFEKRTYVYAKGVLEQVNFEKMFADRWKWYNPRAGSVSDGTTTEAYSVLKNLQEEGFDIR